ncbi:uncharacterized protein J3D65DRAFT_566796 [Phyllosticta citribraziliensis]|uniref:RING-type E3 ubiquitin transferase n=1 Tax=Phyllosticta citribraziliensis TaxID=989973 RepID=A0ABR1M0Q9_9PEZI
MRIAAYVGTSVALAASVLLRAAYERPNFYSACVYLSQSNACLMILANLVLLLTASLMYGLQRLLYGPLRPMEIERLYEHAWFAVTETLLAMTIFRDDVGVWFFVMFVALIAGRMWQWIGAGRVEFVEQQPPTSNEVFFHSRLLSSLLLSIIYDVMMLRYCVEFVLRQARPNMIVMFGFEFALLLVASCATLCRHTLCLVDLFVQAKQMEQKRLEIIEERMAERAREREQRDEADTQDEAPVEVDDNEIDVPGWESKGRYIFYLDLATDFVKLTIYMAFFVILLTFHGLPIHIMRDVLLTFRSFHRRIYDFLRYRNATRDMNTRYPDATVEDLGENNICIICREEMRPWNNTQPGREGAQPGQGSRIDERHRAKKLPCGHCLHISCLKSWLERQQACPTCRQPVLIEETRRRQQANRPNAGANGAANAGANGAANGRAQPQNPQDPANALVQDLLGGNQNLRQIRIGPFRIGYGVRAVNLNGQQQPQQQQPAGANTMPEDHRRQNDQLRFRSHQLLRDALQSPLTAQSLVAQTQWLDQLDRRLNQEINSLNIAQNQLHIVRALQAEYLRLRRAAAANVVNGPSNAQNPTPTTNANPSTVFAGLNTGGNAPLGRDVPSGPVSTQQPPIQGGDTNLPPGLNLPPGWSIQPLDTTGTQVPLSQGGHASSAAVPTGVPNQSPTDTAAEVAEALRQWQDTMNMDRMIQDFNSFLAHRGRDQGGVPNSSSQSQTSGATATDPLDAGRNGSQELPPVSSLHTPTNDPIGQAATRLGGLPDTTGTQLNPEVAGANLDEIRAELADIASHVAPAGQAARPASQDVADDAHPNPAAAEAPTRSSLTSESPANEAPAQNGTANAAKTPSVQAPGLSNTASTSLSADTATASSTAQEAGTTPSASQAPLPPSLQPRVEDGDDDEEA